MSPRLYDSRRAAIQPLPPPDAGTIGLYVCGVTPYDTTHLGHAFTYLSFDVLIRHLRTGGYPVRYVQNLTDVDDDLLARARQVGEDWQSLAERHTADFLADMAALNWLPPDVYPRASERVPQTITLVERLLDAGHAYHGDGHVYLDLSTFPRFGEVSHLPAANWLAVANERGNWPDLPGKRDPLDPVLWQPSAPDEPAWESPFGPGRPGWHIECSAMSTAELGPSFTIHGGGADLGFPHHDVELVQDEGAYGVVPAVEFWVHTGMVGYAGEKMSKSLGNLVLVRDLLRDWSADAIRLALIAHHYREPFTFTEAELAPAAERISRWSAASRLARTDATEDAATMAARAGFRAALDDDLDTPTACRILDDLAHRALAETSAAAGRAVAELGRDCLGLYLETD